MIVPVTLGDERDYPVFIDEEGSFIEKLKDRTPASAYVVITNKTIEGHYRKQMDSWRESLDNYHEVIIEDGEVYKNMDSIMIMLDYMLEQKLDRKAVIIAFGGGVVGDMAGFAASLFLRGVRFVQVPTTLLAMVDSSVGGKTAVNHAMGKNLIGAFYQPRFVWVDTAYLQTLEQREYIAGCGEVMKYGFIGGPKAFEFVQDEFAKLCDRDTIAIQKAIALSVEIKAEVVSMDEKENGCRALLNFGHTFGHVLEKVLGYGTILHGEGVFWGIRCAIELGIITGTVPEKFHVAYEEAKEAILYPEISEKMDLEELYAAMFSDKKVDTGVIRFILPTEPGSSIIYKDATKEQVLQTLTQVFSA